ncbi:MAG: hypothetical protein AB1465_01640 [Patescibacteria group bacterium]
MKTLLKTLCLAISIASILSLANFASARTWSQIDGEGFGDLTIKS